MAAKVDFKKTLKDLYAPPKGTFVRVNVPPMRYVMVDGAGNPNTAPAYATALQWLYSTSYAMKFAAKTTLKRDYVVPPLEGLWWADDPEVFASRQKELWNWTMMIMVPDFISEAMFDAACVKSAKKLGEAPDTLRMAELHEGLSLQTMHFGSYDQEGPTLARLHDEEMPSQGLAFNGPHHEIYLGDPRKTAPERLKTVLRQPVRTV